MSQSFFLLKTLKKNNRPKELLFFKKTVLRQFFLRTFCLFGLTLILSVSLSAQESSCNDGIDNDNDGFVDCADTDCDLLANCPIPTACSAIEGTIHFENMGNNINAAYTTQYLLADTANVIQQVNSDTFFTNVTAGVYILYVLNYETNGGISNNVVGDTIKNITGGCFIVEAGTPFRVCAKPNAVDDFDTTDEDTPIIVNVLLNDTDADSPLLGDSVSVLTGPTQGTVLNPVPSDSSLIYTPNLNFNGLDSIQYEICDSSTTTKLCDTAWVYITITPVNDPPVVDNEMHTTPEDTPVNGDLTDAGDSDPDGTALTANTTPVDDANNGSITIMTDGSYTYTPNLNYNGLDTVVVEICDAGTPTPNECVNDTIFITITPVNDPPVVDNEMHTTPEDTPVNGDLTDAGDSDPDGTALTANTTPVDDANNGSITIMTDGSYTYTPNLNYNGLDTVVVEICDAGTPTPNECVNDTIFITITPVNDPPVVDNEMHTTPEDTPVNGDLTDAGDSDPDGTALTANTTPVDDANNGSITIMTDGSYTYTPNLNYNGLDTVVVEICDAGTPTPNECVNDTIFITITPVNDPPVVDNEMHTTPEDTPVNGDLTDAGDSDPDGTALTANTTPVDDANNGSITIMTDGSYTYTPNLNYNGLDTVVVEICDAGTPTPNECVNDTIFITITPVNDPPVVDNEMHTTPEDTPVNGDLTDAGDSDPDGTALTANTTPVDDANNGSITIMTDGSYTYTPNLNYNGLDTVVVEICDAGTPTPNECVNDTIFITITPVNDPPVVDNEMHTTPEDTPVNGDLTDAGDSDPDGTALTANTTPVDDANNGSITIMTDGSYTYTPNLNYNGLDTVVVEICDAGTPTPNECVNDTIFITITPVNDPPVVDNEMHTTPEDTPVNGDLTDAGDSDPDGTALTANTTPVDDANNGSITIMTDGSYTYTPNLNYNGLDTVVVEICDAGTPTPNECVNDTIFITITPVNDPPVVDNEMHTTPEDTPVNGDLTDAGDSDPDGTALTANTTPVDDANNGSITIMTDGSYTYTPNLNYNGLDTVVVEICDAGTPTPNECVNDTIFITITPVNDPPVVDNEMHTTPEDTPVNGDLTDAGDSDPDGTALTANTTPVDDANNGSITIMTDGSYTYTPNMGFSGLDTVVVSICDTGTPTPSECVNDTIFITVIPDILVEFTDTIGSDAEAIGMNLPTLTIRGGVLNVTSTIDIVLNATPGNATAGTDYLPDFLTTVTVSIPAGDYTTPSTIDLNMIFSITDDSIYEGDETFSIDLSNPQGSSNQLMIGDGDGNSNVENNHIYTIIEDDCAPSGGTINIIGNQ